MNNPNAIANLVHFKPGNKAARPSPYPERGLRLARRHTVEAIQTAIACMRDTEASWPDRMAGVKIILAEGLPKKRDAFEAIFAAAGDGFIEVRFVAPGADHSEVIDAKANGHDATFRVRLDDC
jgi:hypothetical protein